MSDEPKPNTGLARITRYLGYAAVLSALVTLAMFVRADELNTPAFAVTFVFTAAAFVTRSASRRR